MEPVTGGSSFILTEPKAMKRASVTGLLSLSRCHIRGGHGLPQPLSLPVEQNPLAAFLQHQAPTAISQVT